MKVTATISIDHAIKEQGQKQAKKRGFKSFSEYIETLIKSDEKS